MKDGEADVELWAFVFSCFRRKLTPEQQIAEDARRRIASVFAGMASAQKRREKAVVAMPAACSMALRQNNIYAECILRSALLQAGDLPDDYVIARQKDILDRALARLTPENQSRFPKIPKGWYQDRTPR